MTPAEFTPLNMLTTFRSARFRLPSLPIVKPSIYRVRIDHRVDITEQGRASAEREVPQPLSQKRRCPSTL